MSNQAAVSGRADVHRGEVRSGQVLLQLHHRAGALRDAQGGRGVSGRARRDPQRLGVNALRQAGQRLDEARKPRILPQNQGDAGGAISEIQPGTSRLLRTERLC